jgi:hypothetical protein
MASSKYQLNKPLMQFQNVHISRKAAEFFRDLLYKQTDYIIVNQTLVSVSGITFFFTTQEELNDLVCFLSTETADSVAPDRSEYGDFQTNLLLAQRVVDLLRTEGATPKVLVEPTFGKGSFILAGLQTFPDLHSITGFEIYKPYVWQTKFAILNFFLQNPEHPKPEINLFHQDVFQVDFQKLGKTLADTEVLILGNPPWITNAELGALLSTNLPKKSNFKNLNGLDAMTGKGNFDIGEYITLMLLRAFQNHVGQMAFLVKNAVIKNLVFDQRKTRFHIGNLRQFSIDAKKEFGASVEASLFNCKFKQIPDFKCHLTTFEPDAPVQSCFGWVGGQFVSNAEKYQAVNRFDGVCPFEWRQGLKHDCSAVMEFERVNGHFGTSLGLVVHLENDLVYGILKSSELKGGAISFAKKSTIVTQRKVGQDTAYIEQLFPETFAYLNANREKFAGRKSSIYRGKPPFSIFGIGDYSFLPYKVAVSGLYKLPSFTLVLPENGKPMMLDDTCYFIGFEHIRDAGITYALLNSSFVTELLEAISFPDAKRIFTKEILMRINLVEVAAAVDFTEIEQSLDHVGLKEVVKKSDFLDFCQSLQNSEPLQLF